MGDSRVVPQASIVARIGRLPSISAVTRVFDALWASANPGLSGTAPDFRVGSAHAPNPGYEGGDLCYTRLMFEAKFQTFEDRNQGAATAPRLAALRTELAR